MPFEHLVASLSYSQEKSDWSHLSDLPASVWGMNTVLVKMDLVVANNTLLEQFKQKKRFTCLCNWKVQGGQASWASLILVLSGVLAT